MHKHHMVLGCLAIAGLGAYACSDVRVTGAQRTPGGKVSPGYVKPNVVVLMLDDVGFGHLSPFGGPVRTPNIERVAERGLRYTSFHTTALCSPSRAAFLTGRNHHSVGTGKITELASDDPGYTGRIPKSAATFAQVLRQNGYSTYAIGKWHNTPVEDVTPQGPYDLWPHTLGFDHFYGFLSAEANQFAPSLWRDKQSIDPGAGRSEYILDRDLGDRAVDFIEKKVESGEPFLLYYATGTAHAPHHAPKEYIERNKGRFDAGWDEIRKQTLARQKELGIMPQSAELPPRPEVIPAWDSLSVDQKRVYARMQEVNSAAIEFADAQFGRVLDRLEENAMLENTIVIVTSDNGASGEGDLEGSANIMRLGNGLPERLDLAALDDLGSAKTYGHYPAGWALAANTPGQHWKQTTNEGGVRDPFIISWPKAIASKGELRPQFTHIVDVAPTLFELIGIQIPDEVAGAKQTPLEGKSFVSTLEASTAPSARDRQYFEMFGNRAMWSNGWKAVAFHGRYPWDLETTNPDYEHDRWQLFDLGRDPNETNDLSKSEPQKLADLKSMFDEEAEAHHVYPLSDSTVDLIVENAKRLLGDRREFTYEGATRATPEPLSPPVKNHAHSIVAKVHIPDSGANGVIATSGGRFGGYSLYVKGDKLTYVHNFVGEKSYVVESKKLLKPGDRELKFVFEKTGENKGKGYLYVDGEQVGDGPIDQTVPKMYSFNESFDTGMDTGTAAGDYDLPFPFTGRLDDVKVTIDDMPPSKGRPGEAR
ncbi:MAG: arylsulfatase [Labilithrix sp.]|nr:arylsulfatase [Labilithrix sp.]